ncbi:Phosphoinositide phospholipase C [Mycena indigotica]|uniref:Phosphoinositide phospholipase C n=1 Tax=Mycena indigotica TaxID=2126181 RepID=A0A8H6SIE6_9AGAR|nr:Phosphoinositide phospholipase C [Mycena indigotica]KAF7299231.1 Phosphoinositide phospholipase C [Mycena indigotica]
MGDQSPPSARRRLGNSIRRRLGRITARSKSPAPNRLDNDDIPNVLQDGIQLTKVSLKKQRTLLFRLDPERGQLSWESKTPKYIPVDAIRELRVGAETKNYRDQFQIFGQDYEERWLTLIYIVDSSYKTMHLLGPSKEIIQMLFIALKQMYSRRSELLDGLSQGERLDAAWERHYWNGRGFTLDDIERLCRRLKVGYDGLEIQRLFLASKFYQADSGKRGTLDFEDFRKFAKMLKARPDIERIYKHIVKKHGPLDSVVFQTFMKDTQRVRAPFLLAPSSPYATKSSVGTHQLKAIYDFYAEDDSNSSTTLSLEGFTAFLFSADNPAFADPEENLIYNHHPHHHPRHLKGRDGISKPPQAGEIVQDMKRPLSEYFISSSHNTYLSGHQLVGESTIEGYVRALQAGCRCVEIDIHPGSHTPLVTHGNTLTSKVPLRAICEAIDQYAFVASPYPLIISAEVHCSPVQQDMIVEIMSSVFGEKLMRAPIDGRPPLAELPSPEDLRGMILVKTKNLYLSSSDGTVSPTSIEISYTSADSTAEESEFNSLAVPGTVSFTLELCPLNVIKDSRRSRILQKASAAIKHVRSRSRGHSAQSSESPPSAFIPLPPMSTTSSSESIKPKMSMGLVSLLVYTVGVKYRGINKKEEYAPEHMFSLSENSANKLIRSGAVVDLIKHNRSHLIRIYPKGTRLNSSNYLPHSYWCAGAQLVAINWQTVDLGSVMNYAMFQRNGGAGYVLKPPALRSASHKDLLSKQTEHVLELGIISAQQLPSPKEGVTLDTFVEVSLHVPDWTGFHASRAGFGRTPSSPPALSSTSAIYRTSVVKNNGFNPVYEEKMRLPFTCVGNMLDLVFVRFAVRQEASSGDDEPILAVYCAPVACLQQGYRHLPLHDSQLSQYMFSSLFVKISLREL